jgi:hypothetical protein
VEAAAQPGLGHRPVGKRGPHDDRDRRPQALDRRQDLEPGRPVHPLLGDDEVEVDRLEGPEERDVIADLLDDQRRKAAAEHPAELGASGRVVVDDEDPRRSAGLTE